MFMLAFKCSKLCNSTVYICLILQYKPEVETTELALAFPLPADMDSSVIPSSKVNRVCNWLSLYVCIHTQRLYIDFNLRCCILSVLLIVLFQDLDQQQVFAFLPLRSYGFRFIVQGDFELPSSREDVNSDSPWNQWLREEIPSLFMTALEKMQVLMIIYR